MLCGKLNLANKSKRRERERIENSTEATLGPTVHGIAREMYPTEVEYEEIGGTMGFDHGPMPLPYCMPCPSQISICSNMG